MGLEEYKLIPQRPGWKHEYWNGRLRLSPNHRVTVFSRPTDAPLHENPLHSSPLKLETRFLLDLELATFTLAFTASFIGSMDFADRTSTQVRAFAQKFWHQLETGQRGQVHASSAAILSPGRKPRVLSLIVFVERDPGEVLMDCLFTRPEWQSQGLAKNLLARALPLLHQTGIQTIWSGVFEGNQASTNWHTRNGFGIAPDLMRATSMLHRLRHELHRLEQLGRTGHALEVQLEAAQKLEAELEARATVEGFRAVSALEKL